MLKSNIVCLWFQMSTSASIGQFYPVSCPMIGNSMKNIKKVRFTFYGAGIIKVRKMLVQAKKWW